LRCRMSGNSYTPNVWVRDAGQRYMPGQRVDWIREGDHQLVDDPHGSYVVIEAAPDPGMAPERWLRVLLRRV